MNSNKIQLVEVPEAKNVKKLMVAGTFMIVVPVLVVLYKQGMENLDLTIFPGIWAELLFFIGGFLAFLRAYQLKHMQKLYFVEFSEHTLTFRNKGQEQVWIDKKEMEKIEVGELSATIHLKGGSTKILKFGEAPAENIPVIKEELTRFL